MSRWTCRESTTGGIRLVDVPSVLGFCGSEDERDLGTMTRACKMEELERTWLHEDGVEGRGGEGRGGREGRRGREMIR